MNARLMALTLLALLPGAARPADEVQDAVFLGDSRPVLVRLQITIDDQAYPAVWK